MSDTAFLHYNRATKKNEEDASIDTSQVIYIEQFIFLKSFPLLSSLYKYNGSVLPLYRWVLGQCSTIYKWDLL